MAEVAAGSKLLASAKLAPGAFVNLSAAGVRVRPTPEQVKAGAKTSEGVDCGRLDAGQEVVVVSVEFPDRLKAALDRGDLSIVSGGR